MMVTYLEKEEENHTQGKPSPKKRSRAGHFIKIGNGKYGRRDFSKVEPGVLPIWHISIPEPGKRGEWLEKERAREKANKAARQDKVKEKKTCGFCNTVYTDLDQHVESLPHQQMILKVGRNKTPEAQVRVRVRVRVRVWVRVDT